MNKQEQIEEIAGCVLGGSAEYRLEVAELIYNKGYRKQSEGEWIYDEDCECFVCSVCVNSALNNYRGLSVNSNYCPNCGANMKGGGEE